MRVEIFDCNCALLRAESKLVLIISAHNVIWSSRLNTTAVHQLTRILLLHSASAAASRAVDEGSIRWGAVVRGGGGRRIYANRRIGALVWAMIVSFFDQFAECGKRERSTMAKNSYHKHTQ